MCMHTGWEGEVQVEIDGKPAKVLIRAVRNRAGKDQGGAKALN